MKIASIVVILGCIGAYVMAPAEKDLLESYHQKRRFDKTTEPKGKVQKRKNGEPIFVVHQHDATTLHYDLRLEMDGVLKSWAVPKGPSTNPDEKHLAIETEDHPMEYAKFEGVIPEGEYGAGAVIIWDRGTYENLKQMEGKDVSVEDMYKEGKIELFFNGEKMKGAYALIKTKGLRGSNKDNQWLFFKMKDEYADAQKKITESEPESVKSGKTIDEIGKR